MSGRARASIEGGYTRKTLSLPASLVVDVEASLEPGETLSLFITNAAQDHLRKRKKRS